MTGRGDARQLAATLVQGHPDLPVLEVVLVLSTAASGLESNFSNPDAQHQAVEAWRIAALLAVDVHLAGGPGMRSREILGFWQEEDDFFLRAG